MVNTTQNSSRVTLTPCHTSSSQIITSLVSTPIRIHINQSNSCFSAWCDDQDSGILAEGSDDSCHLSHSSDSGSYQAKMRSVSEDRTGSEASPRLDTAKKLEAAVTKETGVKVEKPIRRKHSRASSVDRREIFQKYISHESEHADNVKLYTGEKGEEGAGSTNTLITTGCKQLRVVKLRGVSTKMIGIVLARVTLPELKCHGYHVITLMEEGLAKRYVSSYHVIILDKFGIQISKLPLMMTSLPPAVSCLKMIIVPILSQYLATGKFCGHSDF